MAFHVIRHSPVCPPAAVCVAQLPPSNHFEAAFGGCLRIFRHAASMHGPCIHTTFSVFIVVLFGGLLATLLNFP